MLLKGQPKTKDKSVKKLISHNSEVWQGLVYRLQAYLTQLQSGTIMQNLGNIQEVGKLYAEHRDQFPNSYGGWKSYYLLIVYNAQVCIRFHQYSQANIFLKEAKEHLNKRVNYEERRQDKSNQ